jgi:hypothetical protein
MNAYFLLIDSGAAKIVTVLCVLIVLGVGYASWTGEAEHGDDGHGSDKQDRDRH